MKIKAKVLCMAAVAVVAAAGITGGIARASIPASDGTINGCYKTSGIGTGALFVIDSTDSCPTGYTAINWNQVGPQGPAATSSIVTQDVHYAAAGGSINDVQTVDCTTGLHAINGGIMQTTADPDWQTAANNAGGGQPGQAVLEEAVEVNWNVVGPPTTDPVNPTVPRPVNSGGSWRMHVSGSFPSVNGTRYGMTVTLYVICV